MGEWRVRGRSGGGEEGSALVEFLGVTVVLMVPLVYASIAIGQIQGAAYAAQGASAAAARGAALAIVEVASAGGGESEAAAVASRRADAVAGLAAEDFGVDGSHTASITCGAGGCVDGEVLVDVSYTVPLPGVPSWLGAVVPLEVEVSGVGRADAGLVGAP